ncbi:hypothetical protein D6P11_11990 [Listeria monocytogenes]|nr:hypothetical protein [Listeria monocytogenes]
MKGLIRKKGERIDRNQLKKVTSKLRDNATNRTTSPIPKVVVIDPRMELEKMMEDAQLASVLLKYPGYTMKP